MGNIIDKDPLPIRTAAWQTVDTTNSLCGQLRDTINSAFGEKVVASVSVSPTSIGVCFEVKGEWKLPQDLWFKPLSQSG
jgi:hypothetical protein